MNPNLSFQFDLLLITIKTGDIINVLVGQFGILRYFLGATINIVYTINHLSFGMSP